MKFAKFAIAAALMTMLFGATAMAAPPAPKRSHHAQVEKGAGKKDVKKTHHRRHRAHGGHAKGHRHAAPARHGHK